MSKTYRIVQFVRILSVLFVILACLILFIYSPYYSKVVMKAVNALVDVEVNQVAAKSQYLGHLNNDTLEPGSKLWIARHAYLKILEQDISQNLSENIPLLQQRYQFLIYLIQNENDSEEIEAENEAAASSANISSLLLMSSAQNKKLMEQYTDFLKNYELKENEKSLVLDETVLDVKKLIQDSKNDKAQSEPHAIVVLGGGLTFDPKKNAIVVNNYTKLRLEKTLEIEKKYHLPILLSGVEAPYMQDWLKKHGVEAALLESKSMNTCENSRFTSLLLQKKGGAPTVILITDQYHMPRTRRLFALDGIETIPVEAQIPTPLTAWYPSQLNYDHSRRANYELLATLRDILWGSSDCREVP